MDSTWDSLASSNSMKMEEKLCAVLLPIVLIVDALVHVFACCFDRGDSTGRKKPRYGFKDFVRLSQETEFTVNELEALNVLFRKLSRSIVDDDLIHKEELQLALFKSNFGENLFLDRVFDLFDQKRNGVIDFEEFVRSLNVFHPLTPLEVKLEFSFKLYDLRQTGFIEREEVKQMVVAILRESNLDVSDEMLQNITDRAFLEVDSDGDGKINKKDWKDFVTLNPSLFDPHDSTLFKECYGCISKLCFQH